MASDDRSGVATATRRGLLVGAGGWMLGCAASTGSSPPRRATPEATRFEELERRVGGRIGVAAVDVGTGARIAHRGDERFAMCSTFKAPLAAFVLAEVDRGALTLDREIAFGEADVLEYAPVARARLAAGKMTVEAACAAAVEVSDNTAANLLLRELGGPAALTAFLRRIGDAATRLDREEPDLNTNLAGDPRDTTTPTSMCETLRAIVVGDVLSPPSKARLRGWMESSTTGQRRLRAGLPSAWRAGDKTGSCGHGAANDVAFAWTSEREIVVASYVNAADASLASIEATHADVMRHVVEALTQAL